MMRSSVGSLSRSGHLDVLAAIPEEDREAVLAHCRQCRYRKGGIIWHQGDPAPTVAFLVEGMAVSEYDSPGGRTVITGLWFPGDLIGANNIGTHNRHLMSVRCIETSLVYMVPVERFTELVRSCPDMAEAVIKALSVRLHWFGHLALILGTQTARERVCAMLLSLSEHFAVTTRDGLLINLKLTHETLAAMVGVTRSFLTITLNQLEQNGLVSNKRRRIVIRDPVQLEAFAFGCEPAAAGCRNPRLSKPVGTT